MAIDKRIETNPDGSMSFVMEDTDGSGDLNNLMSELCKKHREAQVLKDNKDFEETGFLHAMRADEEAALDAELDKYDID